MFALMYFGILVACPTHLPATLKNVICGVRVHFRDLFAFVKCKRKKNLCSCKSFNEAILNLVQKVQRALSFLVLHIFTYSSKCIEKPIPSG